MELAFEIPYLIRNFALCFTVTCELRVTLFLPTEDAGTPHPRDVGVATAEERVRFMCRVMAPSLQLIPIKPETAPGRGYLSLFGLHVDPRAWYAVSATCRGMRDLMRLQGAIIPNFMKVRPVGQEGHEVVETYYGCRFFDWYRTQGVWELLPFFDLNALD